jgi:hypothetical protein
MEVAEAATLALAGSSLQPGPASRHSRTRCVPELTYGGARAADGAPEQTTSSCTAEGAAPTA